MSSDDEGRVTLIARKARRQNWRLVRHLGRRGEPDTYNLIREEGGRLVWRMALPDGVSLDEIGQWLG